VAGLSTYRFSARAQNLGLDDRAIMHPRSRWRGCPYWLTSHPDGLPKCVVENGTVRTMSPAKLAKVMRPALDAAREDRLLAITLGDPEPSPHGPQWMRRISFVDSLLRASKLSISVNAYFADWIARLHDERGTWWVRLPNGPLVYMVGSQVAAIVMPIRLFAEHVA
jgi:hypothetical protein